MIIMMVMMMMIIINIIIKCLSCSQEAGLRMTTCRWLGE